MSEKKYKALDYPWHLGHQHEMIKFPFVQWDWLNQYTRPYDTTARGDFPVNWVNHYEPGTYDFVVLHLDQQCMEEGIWERGKARIYRDLNEVITDVPKIVIMHGTPYYPERFQPQQLIDKVRAAIGDNYMVVNSHTAAKQWGFGHPIIHGMDPAEWYDLPKEPRAVTMLSPGGLDEYYDRRFFNAIREALEERGILHCHITVDFIAKNFDDYRNFLGRSLVYINPTKESPMPRSRTEAMLSGCCVLTTPHQDADTFIKDGVNGFLLKRDPQAVAEKVDYLLNHIDEAVRIGQEGKKTALELFTTPRYQDDWKKYIEFVLDDHAKKHPRP